MKISKASGAMLGAGILIITFGSLGISRSQQLSEVKALSDNLSVAQTRLSKLELKDLYSQQDKLNAQLGDLNGDLDADKGKLFFPNDSITVVESLFRIAAASGVQVQQISTSSLGSQSLEKVGFRVLPVQTIVEGEMPNLIDFVLRLNQDFVTGTINSEQLTVNGKIVSANVTGNLTEILAGSGDYLTIVTDDTTPGDDATAPEATRSLARVQMVIYSYQGN